MCETAFCLVAPGRVRSDFKIQNTRLFRVFFFIAVSDSYRLKDVGKHGLGVQGWGGGGGGSSEKTLEFVVSETTKTAQGYITMST